MSNTTITFRDESIYKKSKYPLILKYLGLLGEQHCVEIEYLDNSNCWHLMLPYDDEFKRFEEKGIDASFWSKYRKWQKRRKYTQEEFDRIFIFDNENIATNRI